MRTASRTGASGIAKNILLFGLVCHAERAIHSEMASALGFISRQYGENTAKLKKKIVFRQATGNADDTRRVDICTYHKLCCSVKYTEYYFRTILLASNAESSVVGTAGVFSPCVL